MRRRTLGRLGGVLLRERDLELEEATLPERVLLAGNTAVPLLEVHHAVCAAHGLGEEAEGMFLSPLFPGGVSTGGRDGHGGAHTALRRDGSCRETWFQEASGRCANRTWLRVGGGGSAGLSGCVEARVGCGGVCGCGEIVINTIQI